MVNKKKNVKISPISHEKLKTHCEKNGLKIHRFLEKLIDENCKLMKKDIYGES